MSFLYYYIVIMVIHLLNYIYLYRALGKCKKSLKSFFNNTTENSNTITHYLYISRPNHLNLEKKRF